MASQKPTTGSFHKTADPQLSSPFFALLPAEIRNLIYIEFCHISSPRQHIVTAEIQQGPESSPTHSTLIWTHVPCITDPRAQDTRFSEFSAAEPGSSERALWQKRLKSEWCTHWACEEQQDPGWLSRCTDGSVVKAEGGHDDVAEVLPRVWDKPTPKWGFLDVLRACKRMYLECLPVLYGNTTFFMTDMISAENFLSRYGRDVERYPLRSLELCIRTTNIIPELYYPPLVEGLGDEGPPAIFAGRAHPGLDMKNNPWQRVCDLLVELPKLQDLHIWFDSRDLRPWHKRVSETRFFGRLFHVRVPDKNRFVLGLPELPTRLGPDHQILGGQFLQGENLANAPFMVERGARPNNWAVHLTGGR